MYILEGFITVRRHAAGRTANIQPRYQLVPDLMIKFVVKKTNINMMNRLEHINN